MLIRKWKSIYRINLEISFQIYDKRLPYGEDWFEGIQTSKINDCSTLRDIVCGIFYTYIYIQDCLRQASLYQ